MEIRVSPTRMQLQKAKKKLAMASRGHKLLKDKLDELLKHFLDLVKRNETLRIKVDENLSKAQEGFLFARGVMSKASVETALIYPKEKLELVASYSNIMNVQIPKLEYSFAEQSDRSDIYPYGFANTSGELDRAIKLLSDTMTSLIELAEVEKSVELLAIEIEKTRRRVNALEYVMIPELKETIKYISMKLEEAERGNLTRLMKIKDMVRERST